MAYQDVTIGENAPNEVNVIIEIQKGGGRNKYEFDKNTGRLSLDRVNATAMRYIADYGYVPDTLCEDGDPLDAYVIIDEPLVHGVVVKVRPIGILYFEDEGENDEKIISVAAKDITKDHIKTVDDLGENFKAQLKHMLRHYKDWKNDWQGVKSDFKGWGDAEEAKKVITESIDRYQNK